MVSMLGLCEIRTYDLMRTSSGGLYYMVFECQWRLFYKTSLASIMCQGGLYSNGWLFGGGFPQRIECIPGGNLLMTIVCYVMVKWRGRKPWLFVLRLSILFSSVGSVVTTEQYRWSPWKSVVGAGKDWSTIRGVRACCIPSTNSLLQPLCIICGGNEMLGYFGIRRGGSCCAENHRWYEILHQFLEEFQEIFHQSALVASGLEYFTQTFCCTMNPRLFVDLRKRMLLVMLFFPGFGWSLGFPVPAVLVVKSGLVVCFWIWFISGVWFFLVVFSWLVRELCFSLFYRGSDHVLYFVSTKFNLTHTHTHKNQNNQDFSKSGPQNTQIIILSSNAIHTHLL